MREGNFFPSRVSNSLVARIASKQVEVTDEKSKNSNFPYKHYHIHFSF